MSEKKYKQKAKVKFKNNELLIILKILNFFLIILINHYQIF